MSLMAAVKAPSLLQVDRNGPTRWGCPVRQCRRPISVDDIAPQKVDSIKSGYSTHRSSNGFVFSAGACHIRSEMQHVTIVRVRENMAAAKPPKLP